MAGPVIVLVDPGQKHLGEPQSMNGIVEVVSQVVTKLTGQLTSGRCYTAGSTAVTR